MRWVAVGRLFVLIAATLSTVSLAPAAESNSLLETPKFGFPSWSHDGTRIALTGYVDNSFHLFVLKLDTERLRRIDTSSAELRPNLSDRVGRPTWSPDDKLLAFSNGDFDSEPDGEIATVWVIGRDGAGLRRVARGGLNPAWSPGGRRIAYQTFFRNHQEIHVIRPDGTDERIAAAPDGDASYEVPTWSPDGERLGFLIGPSPDSGPVPGGIAISDGYGRKPKVLLHGHEIAWLEWSPSGREIAFLENGVISLIDLRTKRVKRLLPGLFPTWSPDGKRIAFARGEACCGGSIYVMNRDGSHAHLVLRGS